MLVATGSPWRQSMSSDSFVLRSAGRNATGLKLLVPSKPVAVVYAIVSRPLIVNGLTPDLSARYA